MNLAPDVWGIMPEIVLAVFGLIALVADLILRDRQKWPVSLVCLLGYVVTGIVLIQQWGLRGLYMHGNVSIDPYVRFFQMLILISATITVIFSVFYLKREGFHYGEFYGLLTFIVLGMFIMVSAADLIVFFLGLELMSIPLYIAVGLFRTRKESNEAALKYLIMGAFASAFLIYGIALLYGASGTTQISQIAALTVTGLGSANSVIMLMGMILLIVGFAFKLALVPFHMWTPDVYQGAPTTLTAFMSVSVKAAAYAALVRVLMSGFGHLHVDWVRVLSVLAVITMTGGNLAALRQKNIKRMLAYSSIAHAGYILVAIIALSVSQAAPSALSGIMYYLIAYLLMNFGAFAVAYLVAGEGDRDYGIDNYNGLSIRKPGIAILMSVFLFSLIGMPPLAGFMGKFQVFYSAVKADFILLTIIGVLNSVLAVFYYLRVVVRMYMSEPAKDANLLSVPVVVFALLVILALATILLGIFPSLVMGVVNNALL